MDAKRLGDFDIKLEGESLEVYFLHYITQLDNDKETPELQVV
jgi:hypothetical protein